MSVYDPATYILRGLEGGHDLRSISGFNYTADTVFAIIGGLSAASTAHPGLMTTASTVRIKAGGNAADTAAGLGAQEVTFYGLDENWAEASEAVATAGASASASTTTTFIRLHRMEVTASGAYGYANTAIMTAEKTAGSADLLTMEVEAGQSQTTLFTIPAGYTGYMLGGEIYPHLGEAKGQWRLIVRPGADDATTPFVAPLAKRSGSPITVQTQIAMLADPILAKSDIWIEAKNDETIGASYRLLLVGD